MSPPGQRPTAAFAVRAPRLTVSRGRMTMEKRATPRASTSGQAHSACFVSFIKRRSTSWWPAAGRIEHCTQTGDELRRKCRGVMFVRALQSRGAQVAAKPSIRVTSF
jgi:hypothetical protein